MPQLGSRVLVAAQERLRDQVATALRAALVSGELRPGMVYSAPALAADFGVSATPVREAMLDLAREGLVEAVRNKGFRVTEPSRRDLDEYTELRALIEVPTVGRITRTATAEQLEALRPLAEATVAAVVDPLGYLEADHRFHTALLALAGNARLVETAAGLHKRCRALSADQLTSAREHIELLDHMLAGHAEAAEACMSRHLDRLRTR